MSCSCARHKCQIKWINTMLFCRTLPSFLSSSITMMLLLQRLSNIDCIVLVVTKILLFKRKWQMRVTECESSTNFSKAGVGRNRMQIGNAQGWSICIAQPVLLAKAGINECYPWWASPGLQAAIHCALYTTSWNLWNACEPQCLQTDFENKTLVTRDRCTR